MVSLLFPSLILGPVNLGYATSSTIYWMFIAHRTFGGSLPGCARYCHLAGVLAEASKGHATVLSNQLFQDDTYYSKTSEFPRPFPHFFFFVFCCEMSSLVSNRLYRRIMGESR